MSTSEQRGLTVDGAQDGDRLDRVVATLVDSRAQAQKAITDGRVLVDGTPATKARMVVTEGQRISIEVPADAPRALAGDDSHGVPVVFQDDAIVVIDKPAGLVVHPAPGHRGTTLVELLGGVTAGGPDERPGVVHRLDRDTSGLLVLARTDHALRTLQEAIAERRVHREYLALVQGIPPARTGTIDAPIGRDPRDRIRQAIDGEGAREAITHFEVVEYLDDATLLSVVLDTGRTHQIRVHLEAIGHPVLGDPTYGEGTFLGLERQWLHATRLRLPHPVTGEELEFHAPAPAELEATLAAARAAAATA
ncbi:MAG: RluA family pseudouridine synthase [Patulibacter minatonensis]